MIKRLTSTLLAAGMACASWAGVSLSSEISNNTRQKLANNTVYKVTRTMTIRAGAGLSALYMDKDTTAVLYIPEGIAIKAEGGAATTTVGGGAGVEVPEGSTLVVIGGGRLIASGGNAANGLNGYSGGDGVIIDDNDNSMDEWGHGGEGGGGGNGGGGAGAGIGGHGGNGGYGGEGGGYTWYYTGRSKFDKDGQSGSNGSNGGAGDEGGSLYFLGDMTISATGGEAGSRGGSNGSTGGFRVEHWTWSYRASGGGGGGGGGAGSAGAAYGAGGSGGGGGGGAGSGATYYTAQGQSDDKNTGGNGGGGAGAVAGSGTRTEGQRNRGQKGGDGAYGGSKQDSTRAPSIYKSSRASVDYTGTMNSAESHPAIEYQLTFDDDWRVNENCIVKYSFSMPRAPVPVRYGYIFDGWYSTPEGNAAQYYNGSGYSTLSPSLWFETADRTLYPRWTRDESKPIENVTLYINDIAITEGTDVSGSGWQYVSREGKIYITGEDGTYDIRGKDVAGFASIDVATSCNINISRDLTMEPGVREGHSPFIITSSATNVKFTVEASATCSLTGSRQKTSICVEPGSKLTIDAQGVLNVTGGEGAADLGLNEGQSDGGKIFITTHTHWVSNIRPGHGTDDRGNGLVNEADESIGFYSAENPDVQLWCVRVSELNSGSITGSRSFYIQRTGTNDHDMITPNDDGDAWIWVPNGGYEWAQRPGASVSVDDMWIAYVENMHMAADFFTPLLVEIDGEDVAHLTGNGWYCQRYASKSGSTKATLVITNAGPHIVTGSGNAQLRIECDSTLTVSNLLLNVGSWAGKSVIELTDSVNLDLTIEGTNTFTAASSCAGIAVDYGKTLTIRGEGALRVTGGTGGAGIGGSPQNATPRNGAINIEGGRIVAHGGSNAAGIGSAMTSLTDNGQITITGGHITALGGKYSAAIGGGYHSCAPVKIVTGSIFPTPGTKACAIGNSFNAGASSNKCIFDIAAIYTTKDSVMPAPVNSAGRPVFPVPFDMEMPNCRITNIQFDMVTQATKDIWTDTTGNVILWLPPTDGELIMVSITGIDENGVPITKVWGSRVNEDGTYEYSTDIITIDEYTLIGGRSASSTGWRYNASTTALDIYSGDHSIKGDSTNGTIRILVTAPDCHLTMENLHITTPREHLSPVTVSNSCVIVLEGDNVISCKYTMPTSTTQASTGSKYTAGIEVTENAKLVIEGEGSLVVSGGYCGAGIGSRGVGEEIAGSITINSGYIYATGGDGPAGGGAGIGGGKENSIKHILINGGYVHAIGGNSAAGIGGGNSGSTLFITNEAFRVTGGTVYAQAGEGVLFSDFIVSTGGSSSVTGSKSVIIEGGSVRPAHATTGYNSYAYPAPVDTNDVMLSFAMVTGLLPGEIIKITDPLWTHYNGAEIMVDDGGCVCIWGDHTNVVRDIEIESDYFTSSVASFTVNAESNTIFSAESAQGGEPPEYRIIDGVTCWRVKVHGLPIGKRMTVSGLDPRYARGSIISDKTGSTTFFLPDGEYEFTVGTWPYHASVSGAPTVATYFVGIKVNDVDLGMGSGDGWSYDGTTQQLVLSNAVEYVLSGTNVNRGVTVVPQVSGVKVRAHKLSISPGTDGTFAPAPSPSLEFTGGTMHCSSAVDTPFTISGGSIEANLTMPQAPSGEAAQRVTINGFAHLAKVEITNIEGLENYDTSDIYSSDQGKVFLWLPDGEYFFTVQEEGENERKMIAIVEGSNTEAQDFEDTGVFINGRDAGRLRGDGWSAAGGMVKIYSAGDYLISGTNDGAEVSIKVEHTDARVTLDSLVMTNMNSFMSPLTFDGGTEVATFNLDLKGTNTLYGIELETCAMTIGTKTHLIISGTGRLEAYGATNAAGIGIVNDVATLIASITIDSGDIVARGGENGAGIGGSNMQDGFKVTINGGSVEAVGGMSAAGIGGGNGGIGYDVTVTNGKVYAKGGENGAGIGGGNGARGSNYTQSGGTVVVIPGEGAADIGEGTSGGHIASTRTIITGGSLFADQPNITAPPKDNDLNPLFRITIPTALPDFDIGAIMSDYNGYSLTGVVTDSAGMFHIWLPDEMTYYIPVAGVPYRAVLEGADTVAEVWNIGIEVNGADIATQSGDGWKYDLYTGLLDIFGDNAVISGCNTNSDSEAFVQLTNNVSLVISNLVLVANTESPISIAESVNVALYIAGENYIKAGATKTAGINVSSGATLSITNLPFVALLPDLDNIHYYTNTLYDITVDEETQVVTTNSVIYQEVAVTNQIEKTQTGELEVLGATGGAGIGGCDSKACGEINIYAGKITAKGGANGAGIGGGSKHTGTAIRIYEGEIAATGGNYAAGIGGGNSSGSLASGDTPSIEIFGGRITARGGTNAAGIGSGYMCNNSNPAVTISGGTVVATAGGTTPTVCDIGFGVPNTTHDKVERPNIFGGASIHATTRTAENGRIAPQPVDDAGNAVYCVIVEELGNNTLVEVKFPDRAVLGSGIYSDAEGKIYLWLPNGKHVFYVDDQPYCAIVEDADAVATEWYTGVLANGLDVSYLDGKIWYYEYDTSTLTVMDDCVITGTNTLGEVNIVAMLMPPDTDDEHYDPDDYYTGFKITISNLHLKATAASPVTVTNGEITVQLMGTNILDATEADGKAAISVLSGATLAITNLEESAVLTAKGGAGAAGIGTDYGAAGCGDIYINGGIIDASGGDRTDGAHGAGIGGGGASNSQNAKIIISDGTVSAAAGARSEAGANHAADIGDGCTSTADKFFDIRITGGSVKPLSSNRTYWFNESGKTATPLEPKNAAGDSVRLVEMDGFDANSKVSIVFPDYGTNCIWADDNGKIQLWLADGDYDFELDGVPMRAEIDGDNINIFERIGLGVYVGDKQLGLAYAGIGWLFSRLTSTLTVLGSCTISGTNTEGAVRCYISTPQSVTISNLCLTTTASGVAPFTIAPTIAASLQLAGTNTLSSGAASAALTVPSTSGVTLSGNGRLDVTSTGGAAIGGADSTDTLKSNSGAIKIAGATVTASTTGGAAALGPGNGGTGDQIVITGGSLRIDAETTPTTAVNDDAQTLVCVTVDELSPGAPVAFSDLPEYYVTTGIIADENGKAYLWLPENWNTEHTITPTQLTGARRAGVLLRSAGTEHTFAANGYLYTVTIDESAGSAHADRGQALELATLSIDGFAVEDGWLYISLTATPATWLYGFADVLTVRASATLPIPDSDDSLLDLSDAVIFLEEDDRATIAVPLPQSTEAEDSASRFFKVDGP